MNVETATTEQLIHICLSPWERCEMDLKYAVCRELQLRTFKSEMITDLVRLYPRMTLPQIAVELGVPKDVVKSQVEKLGLFKKKRCV